MPATRREKLESIAADGNFDVVVIGGGINGIGVFRDLALQGVRVLIVERADFCSGCSAALSRMVHGGLRYLENGEFALVSESLRERDGLLKTAPHMVRPLPTTVPIQNFSSGLLNSARFFLGRSERPSSRGAVPIKLGLTLYDWVSRKRRAMPRHVFRGGRATRAMWPGIRPGVKFSATYYDAWVSYPERIGLELVNDAEALATAQAIALNYATIERRQDDGLRLTDSLTGDAYEVEAGVLVNATGAWLDDTKSSLASGDAPQEKLVSGTKGSHLVIDNPRLLKALGGHMMLFENSDSRICLAYPYLGNVLVGATDIRVGEATRVRCEDDERQYILDCVRSVFPEIEVRAGDIAFSFSGIRPLPVSNHDVTGRISRGHFVRRMEGNPVQFCMIGGKWTTFRAFAEQTVDEVLRELGKERVAETMTLPIGGGRDFPEEPDELVTGLCAEHGISRARASHLVDHYGSAAAAVLAFCNAQDDDRPLAQGIDYTSGEIAYLVQNELAVHVSDILVRRTSLAITGKISEHVIDVVLRIMQATLGWPDERRNREREAVFAELETFYGVTPEMLKFRSHFGSAECA